MTRSAGVYSNSAYKISRELTEYSAPIAFSYGTGLSLYQNLLLPAILNARHEIVLTTCYWAASATLDELVLTLKQLSARVIAKKRADGARIKIYICFSSRSGIQKLFHTSSPDGYVYSADKWPGKLGLPSPEQLPGLDITVKSLFFRPFSVLHSKYLIVDRQTVFLPSCNVSWEDWYECAVGFQGPIVQHVFDFWKGIWRPVGLRDLTHDASVYGNELLITIPDGKFEMFSKQLFKTTLLPHPHDSSLRQALWFFPSRVAPLPRTPLNETLIYLITHAKDEVILLTPNFTSQSVFTAICSALSNGVSIHLITNRRMMVPEQLATAGALTEQFVDRLIKEHKRGFSGRKTQKRLIKLGSLTEHLPSTLPRKPCKLRISYFRRPHQTSDPLQATSRGSASPTNGHERIGIASNANKSHIKLTLVDRKAIVLGSGNMDRASWRTSQELGILIEDDVESGNLSSIVEDMWREVERGLTGCLENYFDD